MKKRTLLLTIITSLILVGCEDTVSSNDDNSNGGNITPGSGTSSAVEGVWLLTKDIRRNDDGDVTYEYSYTDKSKYITNYVLMLNKDNSAVIDQYGVSFDSNEKMEISTSESSVATRYTTSGSYLVIDNDAFLVTREGNEMILESSDSKRYFTAYNGLLPLENWNDSTIFQFGFEPLTEEDFVGNWLYGAYYDDYYTVKADGTFAGRNDFGTWAFDTNGKLTLSFDAYSETSGETVYSTSVISKDKKVLALKPESSASYRIWTR